MLNAAIAEQHSEHPLGEAIMRAAKGRNLSLRPYSDLHYVPGKGLSCRDGASTITVGTAAFLEENGIQIQHAQSRLQPLIPGESLVYVGRDKTLLGTISLADRLRAEAIHAIAELKAQGYRTLLLTGDSDGIASTIGQQLGVDEAKGDLLPEQKLAKIRELIGQGHKVAMVGDGINDAPALAEATVGIAMGGGTDVALETADVTLMTADLSRLGEVFRIARRCYRVIMFNFWGTIAVDTLGIVLAFLGFLAPHRRCAHSCRFRADVYP
ncbi:MAG: cation-translocating P-type ATPase [Verrucomicrobia bacterium]|nr:cation-translocating P-type ATPase [Verrucomicrobiota bacterium]